MSFQPTPKLGTIKGPHGEIILTKTYTNWPYSVIVRTDGAIYVKHGDWLSKYSAAMYNGFTHVHKFGRMDKNGLLRPIHNMNLIFAEETVYHIPTYRKTHPMRMGAIEIAVSPLTAEQKEKACSTR